MFPRPLAQVWELLQQHLDPAAAHRIHPLILQQRTIGQDGDSVLVERTIDVRGKQVPSLWKLTYQPPTRSRWELIESQGPWTPGSWIQNTYTELSGGTQIESRGDLTIAKLPFFLSQRTWVGRVLDRIGDEDLAYFRSP